MEHDRALAEHDRKVDLAVVNLASHGIKMCECTERLEHSIERLGDTLLTIVKKNANGNGSANGNASMAKWVDMSMRIILTLAGILALLTLGPSTAVKLLGH